MIHLTNGIGLVFEVGFALFCFVDVLIAREAAVKVLPRWGWVVAILVFPLLGGAAYLLAARSWRAAERAAVNGADRTAAAATAPAVPSSAPAVRAPDDAALIVALREVNEEHEAMLRRWEDDLRAREERLRAAADRLGLQDPRIGGTAAA